ncbi:hypothetical protein QWI17_05845 [Gilvimarinus sp. SDUM040013]|uniref:hypothetical protein n=1 Tax=Gilvimarinus gilvus TaxID=3058038 RepID=UPI002671FF48|nr:hypothetical protein [Gilvimarinus sp. SDUM040013]MDO3385361.1 hypothetical protein [Gilvimarinus sp. SDUM040013]
MYIGEITLFFLIQFAITAVALICMLLYALRQYKKSLTRLKGAYDRLRKERSLHKSSRAALPQTQDTSPILAIESYLQESKDRYTAQTGKTHVAYSGSDSFSGRMSALRYLYLEAEQEASHENASQGKWNILEKKLSVLVSALVAHINESKTTPKEVDNTHLLKQRITALKDVEKDNESLKARNEICVSEIARLRNIRKNYEKVLKDFSPLEVSTDVDNAARSSIVRMEALNSTSERWTEVLEGMIESSNGEGFNGGSEDVSERVSSLKENVDQFSGYLKDFSGDIENKNDSDKWGMVSLLRKNNKDQRNTILGLKKELKSLQKAMLDGADGDVDEVARLEKVIAEFESCIVTLESEVDYLHGRLDGDGDGDGDGKDDPIYNIVISAALSYTQAHSNADIKKATQQVLGQLNTPFALTMKYKNWTAEINRSNSDQKQLDSLFQQSASSGLIEVDNNIFVFSSDVMKVYVDGSSAFEYGYISRVELLRLFNLVSALAAVQFEYIAATAELENHLQKLDELVESIRLGVTNIDIQYAYNTEETKRVVDNLVSELREMVSSSGLDDDVSQVFEAAIAESSQRFSLIYESGSAVDNEISKLSETLDNLDKN